MLYVNKLNVDCGGSSVGLQQKMNETKIDFY